MFRCLHSKIASRPKYCINTNMFLIAVPLFTGLENKCVLQSNISHKKEKNYPFRVQGVCGPVDEVAPRCPCRHADGTVHASTKSQPSSPHPPRSEIWTAKVLSAGMREGTAQSLASNTLKSSYKYRPHGLLTHS